MVRVRLRGGEWSARDCRQTVAGEEWYAHDYKVGTYWLRDKDIMCWSHRCDMWVYSAFVSESVRKWCSVTSAKFASAIAYIMILNFWLNSAYAMTWSIDQPPPPQ